MRDIGIRPPHRASISGPGAERAHPTLALHDVRVRCGMDVAQIALTHNQRIAKTLESGFARARSHSGGAARLSCIRRYEADPNASSISSVVDRSSHAQTRPSTQRNVAGIVVVFGSPLVFFSLNSESSSARSSSARPFASAASNAFMVGP